MANEDLIDDRVSTSQVQKAVEALHAYESKKQQQREEKELLPGKEPIIWLNVTVKQVAPKNKIKPIKIPIVHPIVDPRTTSICLITKDPQREYKDLLEKHNIKFISRVVGIAKLKGKFKAFEARRLLLKENGLFLADDRVIPILPKLLGSKWFEAKKQPIPVSLTKKDLKGELERAISSTYMNQNNGTCTSIKIGTLTHKPTQVVANIAKAIPAVATHIPGGWDNIQNLFIKTNTSVSLPIWSCNLGERWSGSGEKAGEEKRGKKRVQSGTVKGEKPSVEDEESEEGSGEDEESEEEEVEEQPRKKVKSGASTSTPSSTTTPAAKSKKPVQSTSVSASSDQTTTQKPKKAAKPTPLPQTTTNSAAESQTKQKSGKKSQTAAPPPATATKPKSQLLGSAPAAESPKGQTKPTDAGLTKAELKQKRAGLVEKKKEKVVSAKGVNGKSAKAKVLGKKVSQP